MKFFEIQDPYYAVIAAKDRNECLHIYTETVTDEESFLADPVEIKSTVAIENLAKAISDETGRKIGLEKASDEVFACIKNDEQCVLVMDSSLI